MILATNQIFTYMAIVPLVYLITKKSVVNDNIHKRQSTFHEVSFVFLHTLTLRSVTLIIQDLCFFKSSILFFL